jgi:hypothetical protein
LKPTPPAVTSIVVVWLVFFFNKSFRSLQF